MSHRSSRQRRDQTVLLLLVTVSLPLPEVVVSGHVCPPVLSALSLPLVVSVPLSSVLV